MEEVGVDISGQSPKGLGTYMGKPGLQLVHLGLSKAMV
jgi:hypothetical protein